MAAVARGGWMEVISGQKRFLSRFRKSNKFDFILLKLTQLIPGSSGSSGRYFQGSGAGGEACSCEGRGGGRAGTWAGRSCETRIFAQIKL